MPSTKKTKILHVIGGFGGGGMEACLLNFLQNVEYAKFEHFVFVSRDQGELREEFHQLPITITPLKCSPWRYFYTLPYGLFYCLRKRIDVIHGHNYWSYLYGYFLSVVARVPLITTDYGLGTWKQKRHLSWESAIFRHSAANIAVSKAILDKNLALAAQGGTGIRKKFKLVYPLIRNVDVGSLQYNHSKSIKRELGITNDYPTFTIIGRIIELKGHRFAIDAIDRLNRQGRNANLLMVGRLDEPSLLPRKSLQKEYIVYKNYYEKLEQIWTVSDVFLIPSTSEGTPLVLVEYFALGKPVIASNISGNKELIRHGWNGFLFQMGDVDDLVRQIERVMNCEQIKAIGDNARQFYVDNLSPSVISKRIEQEYSTVSR